MRLTQFSDYAWRLLMHVADRDGQRTTIAEAAKANAISRSHLMKVAQRLAQEGFLKPGRGRNGGLMLGKPPEAITLGDVLRVTEPGFALVGCMAGEWCLFADRCQVPATLDRALQAFLEVADQQTLANATSIEQGGPSGLTKECRADRRILPSDTGASLTLPPTFACVLEDGSNVSPDASPTSLSSGHDPVFAYLWSLTELL